MTDKPTARSYSASMTAEQAAGPMSWGDKCFLCSHTLGEADPRGFYVPNNNAAKMFLCHQHCLNVMYANGGHPRDYHQAMALKGTPAPAPDVEPEVTGPMNIRFDDLQQMQDYVAARGKIPAATKVYIGETLVQAGS